MANADPVFAKLPPLQMLEPEKAPVAKLNPPREPWAGALVVLKDESTEPLETNPVSVKVTEPPRLVISITVGEGGAGGGVVVAPVPLPPPEYSARPNPTPRPAVARMSRAFRKGCEWGLAATT